MVKQRSTVSTVALAVVSGRRTSALQAAIREAAAVYAKDNHLRGGPAYHIAKVGRLPLSTVQGFLERDSKHLVSIEAMAEVLGLEIRVVAKGAKKSRDQVDP